MGFINFFQMTVIYEVEKNHVNTSKALFVICEQELRM